MFPAFKASQHIIPDTDFDSECCCVIGQRMRKINNTEKLYEIVASISKQVMCHE